MLRRIRHLCLGAIVFFAVVCVGCTAPERYRNVMPGMTSDEVFSLLGEPDAKKRIAKPTPTSDYFGPRLSATYLGLPEGTLIEIWSYYYFRETWTYVFSLEERSPRVVDTGYYHPSIVY